ncbi:MAG: 30S ribosomal protein S16 [Chlamydiales bacterium]
MALKIRLRQQGRKNRLFYRLVIADARTPRDGKYVESIGWYNPLANSEDQILLVDGERAKYWLDQGAVMNEKVEALIKKAAPQVMKAYKEKVHARRIKEAAARKNRGKSAAA